MVTGVVYAGTVAGAVGSGVIGGLMFGFSTAIMPALRTSPEGAVVMQRINKVIVNPLFMFVFLGTAVVCLALAVGSLFGDISLLRVLGGFLYVVGTVGVTLVVNVPLNNKLDASAGFWVHYLRSWLPWHHVRGVAGVAGSVLLILSLG